jgi:pSer/pThr/pTyr-binding forkhead associated (FHA) protein
VTWLLRCRDRVIPLEVGRHVIGRGETCTVFVDDGLVSREHAVLVVGDEGVTLRDLGSRNGVYLKYRRLGPEEEAAIYHGDTFLIGQTNLVLLRQRRERLETMDDQMGTHSSTRPPASTGAGMPYKNFLAEADRSLADQNYDRFASATHLLLETLTAAVAQGMEPDEAAFQAAAKHALTLAERKGVEWVDQLFAFWEAGPLVPPIDALTILQRLFQENDWESERLEGYLARVRPVLEEGGPRGRALLAQLQGLRKKT